MSGGVTGGAGGRADVPLGGEEEFTFLAGLGAGATGAMPRARACGKIRPVVMDHLAGDRAAAEVGYNRMLPLINLENRQCGLKACKTVMMEGGVIKSDAVRHPLTPLDGATRKTLLAMAREHDLLAVRWGK